MVALIRPERVEAMRKEYVGKKLRVLEDFETDNGELKRGDVGTVVSVDDWGRFKMNWLSGSKDLVSLRDPIGFATRSATWRAARPRHRTRPPKGSTPRRGTGFAASSWRSPSNGATDRRTTMTSNLTLRHYRRAPITFDREREYAQSDRGGNGKPRGFWVSVKGAYDWPWYITVEHADNEWMPNDRVGVEHEVTLSPTANVKIITTVAELDAFTREHMTPVGEPHFSDGMGLSGERDLYWRANYLDWTRIVPLYDGLIIAPYLWQRRLDYMWYYGWDVASGCIWNLDAIQTVKWLIPELVELERRVAHWIDVAFEQFENRMKYGVDDPTGGQGRQLYRIDSPLFPSAVSETRPEEDDDE